MRLLPFALLAIALLAAGCAGNDADESRTDAGGGGATELSANVTVTNSSDPEPGDANETPSTGRTG